MTEDQHQIHPIGIVYSITCRTTDEVYYGSTVQTIERRMNKHRSDARSDQQCTSKPIILRDNYDSRVLETHQNITKTELEKVHESKYIKNNPCVNKKVPGRTREEYRKANREELLAKKKENYEANREEILAKQKEYREDNREEILAKKKENYEANKEKILAKNKKYREANKEKRQENYEANREEILAKQAERITCECGCTVSRNCMARHRKTEKHKNKIQT